MRSLFLYIDPSTGSMLFAVLIGIVSAVFFGFKSLMMKIKSSFGVNVNELKDKNKLNYVIFSDHKRYWNVFEPICDEFEKRGIEVHFWTMSSDDPALDKSYKYVKTEFIGSGNKGFAKLNFMNAHICLSTTPGLDVYQWKRSKDVDKYVHIFHNPGVNSGGYKMFGLDYYDVVLAVSEEQTLGFKELENKRNIKKKEYHVVGSTYLDEMDEKVKLLPKVQNENPVVLIATSWGENSMFEKYSFKIIEDLKKTGYKLIVRPHPQMWSFDPKLMKKFDETYSYDNMVEINKDNDNLNVLNKADAIVCDFSGIIFDYVAVFKKPAAYIITERDLSTYDASQLDNKRGVEEALDLIATEINDNNVDKVCDIVKELVNSGKPKCDDSVINRFWECRGKATDNIVNYMVNN